MKNLLVYFSLFFAFSSFPLLAQDELAHNQAVKVEMVKEDLTIKEGSSFYVALHFELDPKWHIYWKNPGDAGAPISILFDKHPDYTVEEILWPTPHRFELEGLTGFGYEDEATLLVKLKASDSLKEQDEIPLRAHVQFVACNTECVPYFLLLEKTIKVSKEILGKDAKYSALFDKARIHLPQDPSSLDLSLNANDLRLDFKLDHFNQAIYSAYFYPEKEDLIELGATQQLISEGSHYKLLVPLSKPAVDTPIKGVLVVNDNLGNQLLSLNIDANVTNNDNSSIWSLFLVAALAAFAGGALLNLMPCVLPVLSLKVLSVVQAAGESKKDRLSQGVAYVFGVLLSFWTLTVALLILRASGSELGWGFQLQEPIFVGILTLFLFLMALNFFGVFEMGTSLVSLEDNKQNRTKLGSSFFSGVLATLVATPCTGPFLGAALGFAMTLPWFGTFTLFTVMALGMALPFFMLTAYPKLLKFLPKPGNWMIMLKQVFGFVLILTTLWLIWVFEAETSFMSVMWLLGSLFIVSVAAWLYGHFGAFHVPKRTKNIAKMVCIAILAVATTLVTIQAKEGSFSAQIERSHASDWEPFSLQRLEELKTSNTPVFIDFTAKWCLLCQANKAVLHSNDVANAFKEAGIVKMDADWTRGDAEITKLLKEFGRTGVPLYVLYSKDPNVKPIIFSETLTTEMLLEAANDIN